MPQADPPSHASRPALGPSLGQGRALPERAPAPGAPMTLPEEQRRPGPGPRSFGSTWWVGAPFSSRDSVSSASVPASLLEFLQVIPNGGPCSRACTGGHQPASPGAGEGRRSPLSPPGRGRLPLSRGLGGLCRQRCTGTARSVGLDSLFFPLQGLGGGGSQSGGPLGWLMRSEAGECAPFTL